MVQNNSANGEIIYKRRDPSLSLSLSSFLGKQIRIESADNWIVLEAELKLPRHRAAKGIEPSTAAVEDDVLFLIVRPFRSVAILDTIIRELGSETGRNSP